MSPQDLIDAALKAVLSAMVWLLGKVPAGVMEWIDRLRNPDCIP